MHVSICACFLFTFFILTEVTKPPTRIKTITRRRCIYKRLLVIVGFIISACLLMTFQSILNSPRTPLYIVFLIFNIFTRYCGNGWTRERNLDFKQGRNLVFIKSISFIEPFQTGVLKQVMIWTHSNVALNIKQEVSTSIGNTVDNRQVHWKGYLTHIYRDIHSYSG